LKDFKKDGLSISVEKVLHNHMMGNQESKILPQTAILSLLIRMNKGKLPTHFASTGHVSVHIFVQP